MKPAAVYKSLAIAVLLLVFTASQAFGKEDRSFYERFVSLLEQSDQDALELFVAGDPDGAREMLAKLRKRLSREDDRLTVEALRMGILELATLIALQTGEPDCSLAELTAARTDSFYDLEYALALVDRSVRLCPENGELKIKAGGLAARLGLFGRSVRYYRDALKLNPDEPRANLGMAEVLISAGLYRRGEQYLEKCLGAEPGNKRGEALRSLARMQIAADAPGLVTEPELSRRLGGLFGHRLMCMCPQRVSVTARVRLREVTFAVDSCRLGHRARRQLDELAEFLKGRSSKKGRFLIQTHADSTGDDAYNTALTDKRAKTVKQYLVGKHGVDPALLMVQGLGESRPWADNGTTLGRRENRRVEIVRLGPDIPPAPEGEDKRQSTENARRGSR